MYKPRRQLRGEGGVAQMSTLLNKSYLVKVSTKGGGGSKMPQILSTWFVHSPLYEFLRDEIEREHMMCLSF